MTQSRLDRITDWCERKLAPLELRTVAILALSAYFVGAVLPWAFTGDPVTIIGYNLLGSVAAFAALFGWFTGQIEHRDRKHLLDWTTNLLSLNAQEFEWLVGELFRRSGWNVAEVGRHGEPDGNIDLELTSGGTRVLVQCKRWSALIGVNEIRKFGGTLLREGLKGDAGIFVTLSGYTDQARLEADKAGIRIIDGRDLHRQMDAARETEPCPFCAKPMVLAQSAHGWWLRCNAGTCRGKRDLGPDAGKAVALLLKRS